MAQKNGKIVLCFFIRNSCTRFNLVSTLLPSLQKNGTVHSPSPPLTSMCYIVLPFVHFIKSVAVDSPSSHPSFLLPHCYCVYIFLRVGGEGDDTSKTISIFAIKMWFRIDILISSAMKMNLTLNFYYMSH